MVNPIELITAPGKYEYDLMMEELEVKLRKPYYSVEGNSKEIQSEMYYANKSNNYQTAFKKWKK
jgi:hypothetical protein